MIVKNCEIILTAEEQEAVSNAHNIVVERFAAEGVTYDYSVRESVNWCLMGALHIGGIEAMMRYAKEAPISKKRRVTA